MEKREKSKNQSKLHKKTLYPFPIVEEVGFHCRMRWGERIAALVAQDRWHRKLPADNVGASCPERVVGGKTKKASCRMV